MSSSTFTHRKVRVCWKILRSDTGKREAYITAGVLTHLNYASLKRGVTRCYAKRRHDNNRTQTFGTRRFLRRHGQPWERQGSKKKQVVLSLQRNQFVSVKLEG
jgi:hypothetical protein